MNKIIKQFTQNPRQLIKIDAVGAFVTAALLLLIAMKFNIHFGIPKEVLIFLSLLATLIGCYSAICSLVTTNIPNKVLLSIAILNMLYCALSIGTIVYLYLQISLLGVIYFLLEIVIITGLACIEYKVYQENRTRC